MGFPYDFTKHSQWAVTDVHQQPGILMDTYQVVVERTSAENRPGVNFNAKVSRMRITGRPPAKPQQAGQNIEYLDGPGSSLTVQGLPQDLKITWTDGDEGCPLLQQLSFAYGHGNRLTSFGWQMDQLGWSVQPSDLNPMNQKKPGSVGSKKRAWDSSRKNRMPDYLDPGAYCSLEIIDPPKAAGGSSEPAQPTWHNRVTCYFYGEH